MARDQALIVDASVALKWFVDEIDTPKALDIRTYLQQEKIIPIVPALFFYEIANVLRYKTEFGSNDVKDIITALHEFQFRIEPFEQELARTTIELAYQHGITIYDASCIGISKIYDIQFITADEQLYSKLTEEKTILLKDWKYDDR